MNPANLNSNITKQLNTIKSVKLKILVIFVKWLLKIYQQSFIKSYNAKKQTFIVISVSVNSQE